MKWLNLVWTSLLDAFLVHTLRSSMLVGGVALLLSGSGAWQYFSSTLIAHDVQRAAALDKGVSPVSVVVVAIDDSGYESFFSGRSPLSRGRVQQMLETVQANAPSAKRIAVDLDLSPAVGQEGWQDRLDAYLKTRPGFWVLPTVAASADLSAQQVWRRGMCDAGVGFAHPFMPTEFGYPKLTHQYQDSIADAMFSQAITCADPDAPLVQKPMVISPTALKAAVVLPFSGDLVALAEMLQVINPEWVVVGGAWGKTDVFATPFGDRYGVQVHAAALAGLLEGQRQVPYWQQLLFGWIFVGLITALAGQAMPRVQVAMQPNFDGMSGHRFFINVLQPILFVLAVGTFLLCFMELQAWWRVRTGVWVPSTFAATNVFVNMTVVWMWGKTAARVHESSGQAWQTLLVAPIRSDIHSLVCCWRTLTGQSSIWAPIGTGSGPSNGRTVIEMTLAAASLFVQTVAPAVAFFYAFSKPL